MSGPQLPPPGPLDVWYAPPSPRRRPVSVLVVAIIGICYSAIGMLGFLFWLIKPIHGTRSNPVTSALAGHPGITAWTTVRILLDSVAVVILMVGSIGIILLKPWARLVLMGYAIYGLAITLIGQLVYWVWSKPVTDQAMQSMPAGAQKINGLVPCCVVSFSLFFLAYCVAILEVMRRPRVKAAFANSAV